ncbi:MAG: hypothetical protein M3Z29_09070 [Pseudomonadota bacterium]|nr:hypothetical protein [Pseudomonadota bacterium]
MLRFPSAPSPALVVSVLVFALGGCEILKKSEQVQGIVNERVVGMQAGNFFDSYGPAYRREEQSDGSTIFAWVSQTGRVAAGYGSLGEHTCTMQLTADKRGRLVAATVLVDNTGHTSLSRCGEIFKAPP